MRYTPAKRNTCSTQKLSLVFYNRSGRVGFARIFVLPPCTRMMWGCIHWADTMFPAIDALRRKCSVSCSVTIFSHYGSDKKSAACRTVIVHTSPTWLGTSTRSVRQKKNALRLLPATTCRTLLRIISTHLPAWYRCFFLYLRPGILVYSQERDVAGQVDGSDGRREADGAVRAHIPHDG